MLEENFRYRDTLLFWAVQLKNFLTNKKTWCWAGALWLLLPQPLAIAHAQVPIKDTRPAYLKLVVSDAQPLPTPSLPEQQEIPVPAPEPAPAPPEPVQSCQIVHTGDYRKDYIFSVESGGNTCSVNGGGCMGLGQDCNGWLITGRLNSPACPNWRYDVTCQLAYWDWYANTIYGGWDAAYSFRQSHNFW